MPISLKSSFFLERVKSLLHRFPKNLEKPFLNFREETLSLPERSGCVRVPRMHKVISPVNTAERAKLDMRAGDTVRVEQKVIEKGKTRLQAFEGLVLSVKHGKEAGSTFTVSATFSGV